MEKSTLADTVVAKHASRKQNKGDTNINAELTLESGEDIFWMHQNQVGTSSGTINLLQIIR